MTRERSGHLPYGHFGRDDADSTWEQTDRAQALARAAGLDAPQAVPATA